MIQTLVINKSCLIFILVSPPDMTEEGYRGLYCCPLQKRHLLQQKLSTVTSTYALVDTSSSSGPLGKEKEDEEEESEQDNSSPVEELLTVLNYMVPWTETPYSTDNISNIETEKFHCILNLM